MSDLFDRLEAELADLRPRDASPQLRQRIADHQARSGSSGWFRPWGLALAGGLAAAVLALIVFPWSIKRPGEPELLPVQTKPVPRVEAEAPSPTLVTYQRALARSPEALEDKLDKDAVLALSAGPRSAQISAFTRSDAALHALLGED
jgi:hypothetical protein